MTKENISNIIHKALINAGYNLINSDEDLTGVTDVYENKELEQFFITIEDENE